MLLTAPAPPVASRDPTALLGRVHNAYLLPRFLFFFSSRRRHTILSCDWSSDVCSSDNDTATTEIYTLSLSSDLGGRRIIRLEEPTSELQQPHTAVYAIIHLKTTTP